ncbi:PLP-dependent aminotransferase family protein [Streptomyces hundungensis]
MSGPSGGDMTPTTAAGRGNTVVRGSDFLLLDIGDAPVGGKADWLAERLREAMADGRLTVGSSLPATRVLAAELRVSRGVIVEAYRRLTEDGHLEGRRRGGTTVVAVPAAPSVGFLRNPTVEVLRNPAVEVLRNEPPRPAAPPHPPAAGTLFDGAPGVDVFDLLRAAPARVDLTPGRPDLTAFPRAAWLKAERAVLTGLPADTLGYGDPRGTPQLRRAITDWLARTRGIRADPDEVVVLAGTSQALSLLAPVLRADGIDAVAVEDPGSLGIRQHLRHGNLATPPVPLDEDGVRVAALRATGARAVLLTPAHQFPTGVVMSGERRRELLRWARDGGLILEDDYDAEHRYDRPPVPALRTLLADHGCYLGSVSKLLAPALRIGWVIPPRRHRDALIDLKRFTDLGNAVLPQLVLARLMASGDLERQLRLLRVRHRRRRDAMIKAVVEHLPGAVVRGAAAGLHLTVTYEADVPDTVLAAAALARGVKCHPLSWHRQLPGPPGLVLGYAATPVAVLTEGVEALGQALRELS